VFFFTSFCTCGGSIPHHPKSRVYGSPPEITMQSASLKGSSYCLLCKKAGMTVWKDKQIFRQGVWDMQSVKEQKTNERPIRLDKVVELTGYSPSYIYKLVHWKKIPCHRSGSGKKSKLYFLESEIIDFLLRNRQAADYEIADQADAILNGTTV